ncbi:ABC transporter substrate-binding protein [Ferrimicrobium sp.]|uniref:ABC transporter substrate-binding protein n=1 Tax=Ferrimicrobium sp. TaxID=2926050 RepID=UPI002605EC67|nr:ABC transporter substrate-binding protein [Ferrimicrobium sp.]
MTKEPVLSVSPTRRLFRRSAALHWGKLAALDRGPQRTKLKVIAAPIGIALTALLLASCTNAQQPQASATSTSGGVASYALGAGDQFSWILPLENEANYENYDSNVSNGLYRPLYYVGGAGTTGINYPLSIGTAPIYSHGDTMVTIDLRHNYTWSDGQPVTTKDIRFFFELEAAGAKNGDYAPYLSGRMPSDIKSISYQGPYQFTLHLNHAHNPVWFTGNQLTWIYPLPVQTWDKTCPTCHVTNIASTPAGATKVIDFLYKESAQLSTYATNPLWKTIDGPWEITSYNPTNYHAAFRANPHYTGAGKPRLAGYQIYSFTSSTAELDALRGGVIDFGYLPTSDLGLTHYFQSHGYVVQPWRVFYDNIAELGYTGPYRHLVAQLYLRQALQHLVDEPLYLKATLHGNGMLDYGSAPIYPGSNYVSPQLHHDPYPYSVAAARLLLTTHGWQLSASGPSTCINPGTGSNQCGAGIKKGTPLVISMMYATPSASLTAQAQAFESAASAAGITIALDPQPEDTMYSTAGVCPPGPCNWGIALYGAQEDFGQYVLVPTAGVEFAKGNYWGGGYYNPTEQRLLNEAYDLPGLSRLYAVENYQSQQVAGLWWSVGDYEVAVVNKRLTGWNPLNPYANYMPSRWRLARS